MGICDGVPSTAALFQNILNTHISKKNLGIVCKSIVFWQIIGMKCRTFFLKFKDYIEIFHLHFSSASF